MQEKDILIATQNKNVKRRYTHKEDRNLHVTKWKQSGLTMREYCQQQGLALSSFSGWAKPHRTSPGFKQLSVAAPLAKVEQLKSSVEIIVDHHVRVRLLGITDAMLIVSIVRGLMPCS